MPRLIQYMQGTASEVMLLALVLVALSAVMTIVGPGKIGDIATIMSDGLTTGDMDLAAIGRVGIFLAVIYLLECAVWLYTALYHGERYVKDVLPNARRSCPDKINRVPQKYFNTTSQGDILSRITNDVSTLQQGLTNSLPTIVSAATQFVGCLIMMFVTEWRSGADFAGRSRVLGMMLDHRHHVQVAEILHRQTEESGRC